MEEIPYLMLSILALAVLVGAAILPTIGVVLVSRDTTRRV
jgi:hypothetical protein